jgi:serine/threonine-protein kinase
VAATDPYPAATAAGATAVCADGSWSFSKSRSGTCSQHGGVHWWTGNLGPAGPGAH